jgi:AsmA protein
MFRKLILSLFFLLLMLVATALVVPFLIPAEEYKQAALSWLQEKTGRKVTIDGEIAFTLLPQLSLKVEKVTVSNAAEFTSPYLAKIAAVELELELKPLLQKEIKVNAVTLHQPEIWLEQNQTANNWSLKQAATTAAQQGDNEHKTQSQPFRLELAHLTLKDATLHWLKKGEHLVATNVAVEYTPALATLTGGVLYEQATWQIASSLKNPAIWLGGGKSFTSDFSLLLESPEVKINVEGKLKALPADMARSIQLNGALTVAMPSLYKGVNALPIETTLDSSYNQAFHLESMGAVITPHSVVLNPMDIRYGDLKISGDSAVDWSKKHPRLSGSLVISQLNLVDFQSQTGKSKEGATSGDAVAASTGWDTKPINLQFLQSGNQDFRFQIGQLQKDSALTLHHLQGRFRNQQGNTTVQLEKAEGFGGTLRANLALNAALPLQPWQLDTEFQQIESKAVLEYLAGKSRLSGALAGKLSFNSKGKSQREWMQNLQGGGELTLAEGVLQGYALPKLFRNLLQPLRQAEAADSTTQLHAHLRFIADKGVMNLQEGVLKSKGLQADISGKINLLARHLNLVLYPKIVPQLKAEVATAATAAGEGEGATQPNATAEQAAIGLLVPVKIQGSFDDVSVIPDVKGAITGALQNPAQAKQNIEALKQEGKAVLENIREQKKSLKEGWKLLKQQKSPEALGNLLNQLDQTGLPVPKLLDGIIPKKQEDSVGSTSSGAGAGTEPNTSASPDSRGQDTGQQGASPDQGGASPAP